MRSIKQYSMGIILLCSTLGSTWLVLNSNQQVNAELAAHTPESYMTDALVTRMNKVTGLPQDQLYAPFVSHYDRGNVTDFKKPQVTLYQENNEPWHLSADFGEAINGVDQIKLSGHVVLMEAKGPQNPPISISTSAAMIYPKLQYATSDQPVVAKQPDKSLQAVGMKTYFKTGIVELLSKVHGEYRNDQSTLF